MSARLTAEDLRTELDRLLASRITDRELLRGLEVLAERGPLGELTFVYGPVLYARDRALFGRFIAQHFTTYRVRRFRVEHVDYRKHARALDPWLEAVDRAGDVELFRRLWTWKHRGDRQRWLSELRGRHARAVTAPERAAVRELLAHLAAGLLDEATALELYRADRASSAFILAHAPVAGWLPGARRWMELEAAARAAGDEDFALALYQRLVDAAELERDLLARARDAALGGAALADALDRLTPPSVRGFARVALALLEARGADVVPYLLRHVHDLPRGLTGGTTKDVQKLIARARREGHLELWARAVQVAASAADHDEILRGLLGSDAPDAEVLADLRRLAGVSDELNLPGLGLARVRPLTDATAVLFHQRFPRLLAERWKANLFVGWFMAYPRLVAHLVEVGDEPLLDFVASRLVTRDAQLLPADAKETVELLAAYYEGLRRDEARFAERATQVLSQVPAFAVWGFDRLIQGNRLGRLLFLRGHAALLADARGVGDLLEAPNIHVQALAWRALASDDPRAPALARAHLRTLTATLLRPLRRRTRALALGALRRAASTPESAAVVLGRCRDALALPEKSYPREPLLALMADVLHRYPALRGPREAPVVYRRPEVPA